MGWSQTWQRALFVMGCRPREDKPRCSGGAEGVILRSLYAWLDCSTVSMVGVLLHLGDGVPRHMSKICLTLLL